MNKAYYDEDVIHTIAKGAPMVRSIFGIIIGFVVVCVLGLILFLAALRMFGIESFQPDSLHLTRYGAWSLVGAALISGACGGAICSINANRGSKAPLVLIVVVSMLGFIIGCFTNGILPAMDADQITTQPLWALMTIPAAAATGILIGVWLTGREKHHAAPVPVAS